MFDISKCPKDKDGNLLARTVDGQPVTLVSVKGREPWALVGYMVDNPSPRCWKVNGEFSPGGYESALDLINIPEPKRSGEVWVNVYVGGDKSVHDTREIADEFAKRPCISRFSRPWTEGEGLEGK